MASVRKRSNKWQARVTRKGYPAETKTFLTKADAERWSRQLESEMDRGRFVSRAEAERMTFFEVLDLYMKEVSPTKRSGKDEIIRLKAMQRHKMARLRMTAITAKAIGEYRDERLQSCKAGTVVRELGMLSSIINHCIKEWGLAIQNPVSQIRKPAMPQGRDRVLSESEEQRLLEAFTPIKNRNHYMRPMVIVAIETAMRRGEILGLQWEHVNLKKRTAYLPITKNGEPRTIPLSSRAVKTIQQMPRSIDGRVFAINAAAMETCFKRGRERALLPDIHFHDLRHTATTRLAGKLSNILELSAITGHKELRMLKRYYHPKAEDLAKKLG